MKCYLEYLGKGAMHVQGVGRFGLAQVDRKTMAAYQKKKTQAVSKKEVAPEMPKPKRVTKLPCTEEIAKQFEKNKDFKVHREVIQELKEKAGVKKKAS